jgi:hypothetical protein
MLRFARLALIAPIVALTGLHANAAPVSTTFKISCTFVTNGYSDSQRFSNPKGVFYNPKDHAVYVADTGNGQIVVVDSKGNPFVKLPHAVVDYSSGERKTSRGAPRGIVVRSNGDMLVTDNMCQYIDVLDFTGRSVEQVWPGDLLGIDRSRVRPGCIAIDGDGCIYISVSGDVNGILVLTPGLELKSKVGMVSGATGGMRAVTGLWVDKTGKIYATYAVGECVCIYSPDGRILHSFGTHDAGYANFSLPSGVVTDAQGDIWVLDTIRHSVTVFSQTTADSVIKTAVIHVMAGPGVDPGHFLFPSAISGDGDTKIFVLEGTGARLQGFDISFNAASNASSRQEGKGN